MKIRKILISLLAVILFGTTFTTAYAASFDTDIENGLIKRWSISTDNFRIEFSPVIKNQVDSDGDDIPDLIETVADAAEESWEVIIDDLGYEEPIQETNHKVVIILDDTNEYLSPGAIGITSILSNGEPYIALDPWMSDEYLQITLAHEFFHAVQFGYEIDFAYSNQGVNWAEATAVWVEEKVYDDIDDYLGYLYDYFDYPDYSIFAGITPSDTLFEYALSIWPIFLSEYYNDDMIQDIWENYFDSDLEYDDDLKVYDSVKDAVEDEGDELWEVYQDFTLWNLDWEQYEEGYYFPEPYLLEGTQGEYTLIEDYYAPALYGANYLYFYNDNWDSDFYFHIIKSEDTSFVVTLVPVEYGDADLNNISYVYIDEDDDLTTEISVSDVDDAEAVVAIVSPLESVWMDNDYGYSFDEGYLYYYLAQFGESIADEIDTGSEVEESGSEKEGEDSSIDESSSQDDENISLSLVSYDEDSAIFSWTRLADDDIEGYVLQYGTESGDYDYEVEINKPQTTYGTVDDLEEGETYYFSVYAIDDDGDEVGDESNEIAIVPEEWLFTDVSHMEDSAGAIEVLVDEGIFEGYDDGSFDPNGTINRAELLKILIEGQGLESSESYSYCFDDVGDQWYAKYVCYAEDQGWVNGYPDGTFKPANPVSKVEALKILFNVYEAGLVEGTRVSELPYPDLGLKAWYSIYVYEAAELGILSEEQGEDFNASDGRTRSDMAEELYRYLVVEELI